MRSCSEDGVWSHWSRRQWQSINLRYIICNLHHWGTNDCKNRVQSSSSHDVRVRQSGNESSDFNRSVLFCSDHDQLSLVPRAKKDLHIEAIGSRLNIEDTPCGTREIGDSWIWVGMIRYKFPDQHAGVKIPNLRYQQWKTFHEYYMDLLWRHHHSSRCIPTPLLRQYQLSGWDRYGLCNSWLGARF
jgi:hypothetical protein